MTPVWLKYLPAPLRRQLDSPLAQKLVGNTGWLFADKILRAVGELTVGIWIARYLGPEQFGMLNYAIAFVALFTPLYTLGLDKIVVRDIVQAPEQRETTLGSALGLRLVAGGLAAIAAIAAIVALRPGQTTLHWLVGLMAFGLIFQASDVVTFWFQSQIQAKQDVAARSTAYGVTTLIRISCILAQLSIFAIGLTYVFEPVVRAIGLTVVYWKFEGFKQKWQFNLLRAQKLLMQSWPIILSSAAVMIYMRIDQVMLGQLATDESVGIYSAAIKLAEGWYFIPVTIASSVFPAIVRLREKDRAAYRQNIQTLFKIVTAISYSVILALILLSRPLVLALFGMNYLDSSNVLFIHAWAGIFASLGTVRGLWMMTEDLLKFSLFFYSSGAALNITLNYFLIPPFSAVGASLSTLISYFFAFYAFGFIIPQTRRITVDMSKAMLLR